MITHSYFSFYRGCYFTRSFYICCKLLSLTVCRAHHGTIVNNPTINDGRQVSESTAAIIPQPDRAQNYSSSMLKVLEGGASSGGGGGMEVYKAAAKPIIEEKLDLEAYQSHTLPYTVHAYDDNGLPKDVSKAVLFKKSNKLINSRAGKKDDQVKSVSSGGGTLAKLKPRIPSKPALVKSPTLVQLESDPRGAYSELDKKTSYSTLEPHIGKGTVVTAMVGEDYNLLND